MCSKEVPAQRIWNTGQVEPSTWSYREAVVVRTLPECFGVWSWYIGQPEVDSKTTEFGTSSSAVKERFIIVAKVEDWGLRKGE